MRITPTTNQPSFGIRYNKCIIRGSNKQIGKVVDNIELDNGKTIAISTQMGDNNKPLEKFYILFDNTGEWVKFKIKTFYNSGKYSTVNIDNTEATKEFLG